MKFSSKLERFDTGLWDHHLKVPNNIVTQLQEKSIKRILCSINGRDVFHTAVMPAGEEIYFINLNQEVRRAHNIEEGDSLEIQLLPDESEYGMPMPVELREVLDHDPEFDQFFHKLPPGKRRNLIYIVNKVKNKDLRIHKAVVIAEHLNEHKGKIDFKILMQAFKSQP